jgi:hypothetical protein
MLRLMAIWIVLAVVVGLSGCQRQRPYQRFVSIDAVFALDTKTGQKCISDPTVVQAKYPSCYSLYKSDEMGLGN